LVYLLVHLLMPMLILVLLEEVLLLLLKVLYLLLLLTPVLLVTRLWQRVLRTLVLVLIPMPGVSAVVAFFLIDLTAPDTDAVVAAMAAGATNACDGTDRPPWSPSHHQR
jgi:hypothetical protein